MEGYHKTKATVAGEKKHQRPSRGHLHPLHVLVQAFRCLQQNHVLHVRVLHSLLLKTQSGCLRESMHVSEPKGELTERAGSHAVAFPTQTDTHAHTHRNVVSLVAFGKPAQDHKQSEKSLSALVQISHQPLLPV